MQRLPDDIVADILSRLTVKKLLQIKCVCKPWNTTISDPQFAKLQLQQSNNNNGNNFKILVLTDEIQPMQPLCLDYENDEFPIDKFVESKLDFPLGNEQHIQYLGYCDGLFCLRFGYEVVLWNPAIRKCRRLPSGNGSIDYWSHGFGFGFDSVLNDYKVYRVFKESDKLVFDVFALKTNYWRRVEVFCPWSILHQSRNFLNGSLHWLDTRFYPDRTMFVAFNLANEKFLEIPLPDGDGVMFWEMVVFDGCLSVCFEDKVNHRIDIWAMKEYMVKASWSKLGTVLMDTIPNFHLYLRPLCYARNGDILLEIDGQKVVKYNMNEKRCTAAIFNIRCDIFKFVRYANIEALAYVESLVSPNLC